MLEVLIALAVLSIGLLGLAALQSVGLRIGHDSYQRTQATMLAYDMADRMRANPTGVAAGKYDNVTVSTAGGNDCVLTTCTTDQLADYDIKSWHAELVAKLAQGQGTISAPSGSVRTITVLWSENDLPMKLKILVQL